MTDLVPLHRTLEPSLSSFLLSEGAALDGFRRLGPKTVEFRFVADERLHHLIRLYRSGQPLLVVPARLFAALRVLKRRAVPLF